MYREEMSAEQYLQALNELLQLHRDYRPGMRFVLNQDRSGFDWEPLGTVYPLNEVSSQLRRRFAVRLTKSEPPYDLGIQLGVVPKLD